MSHPPASRPARPAAPLRRSRRSRAHSSNSGLRSQPVSSRSISSQPLLTPHRKKVLWAGGAITLLAMATLLPTQVSSQAIPSSSCEQVIKSGAEISRGQLSTLLTFPVGTRKSAVRQAMNDPYCTMPALAASKEDNASSIEREAYPLAFDLEAWVVLSYEAGEYSGYDFVFKP